MSEKNTFVCKITSLVIALAMFLSLFSAHILPETQALGAESEYPEPLPQYPEVSAADFMEYISQAAEGGHPYLFGRQADFDRVKEYAFGKDAVMTEMYQKFKDTASNYVDDAVSEITSGVTLSRATKALSIIRSCAFVYMIEGESASDYANRAVAEAMYFVEEMDNWGRAQSLDVNHAALGIAICYDWLYNYMTDAQREAMGNAMFEKHLNEVYDFFTNPTDPAYKYSFHQMYLQSNNHAMLDNTSVFVQALAVSDVDAEKSSVIMDLALEHLTRENGPFDRLYPDAGWYEGSNYWAYVGPFMAMMFSSMESAFGTTFGFENNPYITGNAYFPIYTQSERTRFMYSDAFTGRTESSSFYYFGHMSGDEALQKYVLDKKYFSEPFLCLWYNPEDKPEGNLTLKKDKLFRNIDVATMRSTWEHSQELFVGMAVQKPKDTHAFMAMGTLMLDALGETWITNPGKEYYDIGGYWDNDQSGTRWTYYSTRAEANSCVVINPSEDGGQLVDAASRIDELVSGENRAYMVSDITDVYTDAESYRRGVMIYDNRSKILLQDEITLSDVSDVYSFINVYQSDIEIAPDGSYAILSKGNKHLYVKVVSDKPCELITMEANSEALGTSPNPDNQTDFTEDFERLCVKYENVSGSINLSVVFVPYLSDDIPEVNFEQTPISQWSANETIPKKPVANAISVNGKAIDGFNPDANYYKLPFEFFEADFEVDAPESTVSIKNNYAQNCFDIYLTNNSTGAENHYCIEALLEGEITADTFVGGSYVDDKYDVRDNYGSLEEVRLRLMSRYSLMAYYKLKMPYIPIGKTVKEASLVLNQYRITNSSFQDSYEFHLVSPNSWSENSITYMTAPVRHNYNSSESWYPYLRLSEDGTYAATEADMTAAHLEIETIPKRYSADNRFYKEHSYNITPLVEKSEFDDYRRFDNEFSFGMGHVILTSYGSSANTVIASRENTVEAFRPKFLVEMQPGGFEGMATENAKIITNAKGGELYFYSENSLPKAGDSISAITYAVNTDADGQITLYLAQYDSDGELLAVSSQRVTVPKGEAVTVQTPPMAAVSGATVFKAFTWDKNQVPSNME